VSRKKLVGASLRTGVDRDSQYIEVFVGRIRTKLGVEIIKTVLGLGYCLTPTGRCALEACCDLKLIATLARPHAG